MKNKVKQQATILLCGFVVISANSAWAREFSEAPGGSSAHRQLALKPEEGVVNTDLSAVRDWGLINRQMKEQAMNLYLEATRIKPTAADSCEIMVPSAPSVATTQDGTQHLPPRCEWVAYYLNTMEPLLQYVTSSLRASESGKVQISVPKGTGKELEKVADKMFIIGHRMEKTLDQLNEVFNQDQPAADQLKNVAAKIFDDTTKLEECRCQYYEIVRKAEKDGVKETEILPPVSGQKL